MENTIASQPRKSIAVTLLALGTLLLGGYCAVFGGGAIFTGIDWINHPSKDAWVQAVALGGLFPAVLVVVGIIFLLAGILSLLAGLGLVIRRGWGRFLTYIVAVFVILFGLMLMNNSQENAGDIGIAALLLLAGVLAIVILITKRKEFQTRRS